MKKVSLEVNGKKIVKNIPDHTILSVLLRDILNLTGTHIGCDTSQCGACVVHVDGKSIKSCTTLAVEIDGSKKIGYYLPGTDIPINNEKKLYL